MENPGHRQDTQGFVCASCGLPGTSQTCFERMKTLGPCDIDLSRLNLTPHAIAVYASQPLSQVATQHSLPSGRDSLLGPDSHRLDRTSLRLAHSLDDLVGAGEY
jgi:hypothetical protein